MEQKTKTITETKKTEKNNNKNNNKTITKTLSKTYKTIKTKNTKINKTALQKQVFIFKHCLVFIQSNT